MVAGIVWFGVLAGCSGEYTGRPNVGLKLVNRSDDRDLYYVHLRNAGENTDEEYAMTTASFMRLRPGEERVIGLGGDAVQGDEGGCVAEGEVLWIIESPSGVEAPIRIDDDDSKPAIRSELRRWVPDARVWEAFRSGACFESDEVELIWP